MSVQNLVSGLGFLLPISVIILLFYAAYTDWMVRRIPNLISAMLILLFAVHWALAGFSFSPLAYVMTGSSVLLLFLPLFALGKMGGGDVKLMAAVALWIGPQGIVEFLIITTFAGAVLALFYLPYGIRSVLEWGLLRIGVTSTNIHSAELDGIPYGLAIGFAGTVMIWKNYVL